ncbi:UNVERIFIED_ORG: hypothetical protein FHR35_009207 [Microbispora rosea subsp. rosea]|nr:hypothetical protein Misp03_35350 [Microbispora sp. NBRC 16548]
MSYLFDEDEVALAHLMEQRSPGWVIIWRRWARTYMAWHTADPNRCRCVESADPDKLRSLMIDAEVEHLYAAWSAS